MRRHLRYRNIDADVREATDALFAAAPWRAEDNDEQARIGQEWLNKVSGGYNVIEPVLTIGYPYNEDEEEEDRIVLDHWSIFQLFRQFRTHVLDQNGMYGMARDGATDAFDDSIDWAASLFYSVRPKMFRARVREGRIGAGITPRDTFTNATATALDEAGLGWGLSEGDREWRLSVEAFLRGEYISDDGDADDETGAPDTVEADEPVTTPEGVDNCETGDYNDLDVTALRRLAGNRNINGAWSNTKDQNVAALRAQDHERSDRQVEQEAAAHDAQAGV